MLQVDQTNRDRAKSAVVVAAIHGLIGYAFISGLGFDVVREVREELKMFDVRETPPPPPTKPAPPDIIPERQEVPKPKDPEGAASPANLKDTPSPVVVPEPKIKLKVPPPIVAAPVAGQGNAASAGAALVPGPGTGSGGIGNGLGSGRYGNGTGGGGGGGMRPVRARHVAGSITDSDYPQAAYERGIGGVVYLRFVVAPSGRVSECRVTRSSGSRDLDNVTCRLIKQRFVYRPARDAAGRPVAETISGEHLWEFGGYPGPPQYE